MINAVVHDLARFVDTPEHRADVDLVGREWDAKPQPAVGEVWPLRWPGSDTWTQYDDQASSWIHEKESVIGRAAKRLDKVAGLKGSRWSRTHLPTASSRHRLAPRP